MSGNDPLFVGIDIGTSGVRAVAITADGAAVASGSARLADHSPDHRDPAGWRSAFSAAIRQMLARVEPSLIRAVSIDGTSGTVLPVDGSGRVLAPPMMYNDAVADSGIVGRISQAAPTESAAHGATSGLAKAMVFSAVGGVVGIIHQADWLAGLLTGRFDLSDENNALKSGYDPVARCWPDWIGETGFDRSLLPKVLPAGTAMAPVSTAAAGEFGFPADTLVVAGTTDGCASFLATGASRPGDGVSALGTTLTVKMLCDAPLFAPEFGLYSHRIGDMWLAGGASNTGGNVLRHFFDDEQLARLSDEIDPAATSGLDYYPLVAAGERFPVNDPGLAPRLTPRPANDAVFLQGLFEGMAGIEAQAYQRLASVGAPALTSVRTVGGGAKNAVWSQIRARSIGVDFLPALSDEAAAGTARLALAGARTAGVA